MKKFISSILVVAMVMTMTACNDSNLQENTTDVVSETATAELSSGENTQVKSDGKILVAYFSYGENADLPSDVEASTSASINIRNGKIIGNTGVIAELIAQSTGGDIHSIMTEEKYTDDYDAVVDQGKEEKEVNTRPVLMSKIDNLDEYDTVFIGFPNWWYDMPMAMYTFFDEYDFSGKTIIPFCTSGGSGFSDTIESIKELEPNAKVEENGLSIGGSSVNDANSDVTEWLNEIGY